jgi:hypothetical protein
MKATIKAIICFWLLILGLQICYSLQLNKDNKQQKIEKYGMLWYLAQERGESRAHLFNLNELYKYSDCVVLGEVKDIKVKCCILIEDKNGKIVEVLDADKLSYEEILKLPNTYKHYSIHYPMHIAVYLEPIRFFKAKKQEYKRPKRVVICCNDNATYIHPSIEGKRMERVFCPLGFIKKVLHYICQSEYEIGEKILAFLCEPPSDWGMTALNQIESAYHFWLPAGAWSVFNLLDDTFYLQRLYICAKYAESKRLKKEKPIKKEESKGPPILKSYPEWEYRYHPLTKITKEEMEEYYLRVYGNKNYKNKFGNMGVKYSKEEMFSFLEALSKRY